MLWYAKNINKLCIHVFLTSLRSTFSLDSVNRVLKQFGSFCGSNVSVDEQMLSYYGTHTCRPKQFIWNKPVRFGYKAWAMCCEHGYPFFVDIYQSKGPDADAELCNNTYGPVGVGGRVILRAIHSALDDHKDHVLFLDNFFTSYSLLMSLSDIGLRCTGTIRQNRTGGCSPLPKKDSFKKRKRIHTLGQATERLYCVHGRTILLWHSAAISTVCIRLQLWIDERKAVLFPSRSPS